MLDIAWPRNVLRQVYIPYKSSGCCLEVSLEVLLHLCSGWSRSTLKRQNHQLWSISARSPGSVEEREQLLEGFQYLQITNSHKAFIILKTKFHPFLRCSKIIKLCTKILSIFILFCCTYCTLIITSL